MASFKTSLGFLSFLLHFFLFVLRFIKKLDLIVDFQLI